MRPETRELLLRLLEAPAPSGFETEASKVWREAAAGFAEVRSDVLGTSYATVGAGRKPRVAIVGHVDEIGLIVHRIDESGMLRVRPIGSWDATVLVGQRTLALTRQGTLPGVIGRRAVHLQREDENVPKPRVADLWVDVGARDGAEAAELVRVGDPLVLSAPPVLLHGDRVASRALDNRAGALVALEAARLCAERGCDAEVVAVASTQEELSYAGAAAAMHGLEPDVAIVVDCTHASDTPGTEEGAPIRLGGGPTIMRGSVTHPALVERLISVAEEAGIAHCLEGEGTDSLSDAEAVHSALAGIASALVSVPLRSMHTPVETVQLSDIEATAELVARFCQSLRHDEEWTR